MATLEQIQARMKKLQAQAETLLARQAQAAVDQIRNIMLKHGLTTADIEAKAKARREARSVAGTSKVKALSHAGTANGKMPPKYRDPKSGATWSGHARPPAWIRDVKDRTKFLISDVSDALGTGKTRGRPKKVAPTQTQAQAIAGSAKRKGKQPPKYKDPRTGATWSGRGPAPAWLASAKDRSRFLIEAAASATRPASKKAVASKKSAGAKRASTKAASKKVSANAKRGPSTKPATKKAVVARKQVKRAIRSKASANGANGASSPVTTTGQDSAI
jgi:DNA-binding protein H-NS